MMPVAWRSALRRLPAMPPGPRPSDRLRRWAARVGPWPRVLALAAVVGLLTGLFVVVLERLIIGVLLDAFGRQPLAVQVAAPFVGLVLAAACLHWLAGDASPSTTDEYIRDFHDRGRLLPLGPVPGRVLASVATIGFGCAQGLEGPSIYGGAAVGSVLQRRFARHFSPEDMKMLVVAGAAAGLSAIFKTPATGAIFALEVPYRNDLGARAVLPAIIASTVSYLTFVSFLGTEPLLQIEGDPALGARDLLGAAAVGLLAGAGARLFSAMVGAARRVQDARRPRTRALCVVGAGAGLAGVALVADAAIGLPLTLGPGYDAIRWTTEAERGVALVALLFVLRALATGLSIAGGGAGGTFIPLVVQGALLGRLVGFALPAGRASLFTMVGAAAFVGAGYRTPLAGVMFVAESTGRPGFVVPGLIATALAQLVMGGASVADHQKDRRGVGTGDD